MKFLQKRPDSGVRAAVLFGANFWGYRFSDFVRGGAPLLVLMLAAYSFLLPRFFPL